jgi:hypothetical protein
VFRNEGDARGARKLRGCYVIEQQGNGLAERVGFGPALSCAADYVGVYCKDHSASLTSSLNRFPSATAN